MFGLNLIDALRKIAAISFVIFFIGACQLTKQEQSGAEAFERIPPGESAQIARITVQTTELQDKRTDLPEQMGELLRGVHPKSHGCVSAEFVINPDIGKEYRVGLFSIPGRKYKAQIRFSNASVKLAHDLEGDKNGSRGMAIKVFDVEGEFLQKDHGRQNQDFLMINTPEFAFADVRGYGFLTDALHASTHGNDANKLLGLVLILAEVNRTPPPFPEPGQEDLDKLKAILASQNGRLPENFSLQDLKDLTTTLNIVVTKIQTRTVRNPLQVQYFGAAPFLFGPDNVMKFSAAPADFTEQLEFDALPNENYLREAVAETMNKDREISFDFKILVRDRQDEFGEGQVLIESATTTWDSADKNEIDTYVNVAKINIVAPQQTTTDSAKAECEKLAFTPWHSLAAHQPVGGINRLRKSVYIGSAHHRGGS
jgi:hypothetical protein